MMMPIIVGLAVGISFVFILSFAIEQVPSAERAETIVGKVVCLPPKPDLMFVRSVCVNGFHDIENDRYYALSLEGEDRWLATANNSDELFIVTASIRQPAQSESLSTWDISGVMDNVTSINTPDGNTSIYEVKYRHTGQLLALLHEIRKANGGGWGMGIFECDGKPCIRITLEKDAPEWVDKIPREIEGYKVDVQVSNN